MWGFTGGPGRPEKEVPLRTALVPLVCALLVAAFALSVAPGLRAEGDGDIPKLEKHPLFDAKPGEFLRWKETAGGDETTWFVVRVLATNMKENKVFAEAFRTSEDGKEDKETFGRADWMEIPKFEPKDGQTYKKDEMVWKEVNGKKVACRYLVIEEQINPGMPAPVRKRKVWYSNELLASGKVEEWSDNPVSVKTAVEWGTLSADELTKRRAVYEKLKDFKDDPPLAPGDAEKPPEKPADGCGGGKGCGK
jgi:hypothetical protein